MTFTGQDYIPVPENISKKKKKEKEREGEIINIPQLRKLI